MLSPSVVRIVLKGETCSTWVGIRGNMNSMLRGLPESKADLLSHLEVVAFLLKEVPDTTAVDSFEPELLHACNEAGVKLFIQNWRIGELRIEKTIAELR